MANFVDMLKQNERSTRLFGSTWTFKFDPLSGGIFAVDTGGFLMEPGELDDLYEAMQKLYSFYGEDQIDATNQARLDEIESHPHTTKELKLQPKKKTRGGWVYLVKGEGPLYKVGMTTRQPSERLAEFVPKLPFEASLVYALQTSNVDALEKYVHSHFDGKHVNGEWFKLDKDDVEWFKAGAR